MNILVVDDNQSSAMAMARILRKQGHDVTPVFDGASAIEHIQSTHFDLVFTDLKMEPVDGMAVLAAARQIDPPLEVIVFTAFGAVEYAVEAMQLGARDFLTKPISVDQILSRVRQFHGTTEPEGAATSDQVASSVRQTLGALAHVTSAVWLEGELGSGRVAAAQLLHQLSGSSAPAHLLNPALAQIPDEGFVILPSVDELDEAQQASLSRAIRGKSRVRFVATAQPGVRDRVAAGTFHSELYFQLAVLTLEIPALRDRAGDIVPLFKEALNTYCESFGRPVPTIRPEQERALTSHQWPANLRELHNLAERTAVLGEAGFNLEPNTAKRTTAEVPELEEGFKLAEHMESVERQLLSAALEQTSGDRTAAGRLLGVERNTLRYKLNKYGLL